MLPHLSKRKTGCLQLTYTVLLFSYLAINHYNLRDQEISLIHLQVANINFGKTDMHGENLREILSLLPTMGIKAFVETQSY